MSSPERTEAGPGEQKAATPPEKKTWPASAKAAVGALVVVAALGVGYGIGNSGGSSSDIPAVSGAEDTNDDALVVEESTAAPESPESADPVEPLQFGEKAELRGGGTTTSVNPERFFKTLQPDAYGYVEDHQKLVGVILSFKNEGGKAIEILPGNDVLLIDSNSGQWSTDHEVPASGSQCAPDLEPFNLAPGAERRGCITYTIPKKSTPASVQVQLDSGYGPDLVVWDIPSS